MEKRTKLLISGDRLLLALDVLHCLAHGKDESRALSREKVLHVLHAGLGIDGDAIAKVWAQRGEAIKGFWFGARALVRGNVNRLSGIELDVAPLLLLHGETEEFGRIFQAIAHDEIMEESLTK